MVHKKGIIHYSCANALYPAARDKCILTCFSKNFRFEDFFWMLQRATCCLRVCSWTTLV